MGLIVQKYGGSSLADKERILNVARRIVETKRDGNKVIAIVSAMGKTTDKLIQMAREISEVPPKREMDRLLSTGEQISMSLLAMAIQAMGEKAISLSGPQAGIMTDAYHSKARIKNVAADRLKKELEEDNIIIVAGFQGENADYDVTTLGRGGSDTSAVAIAAAVDADLCEIFTDVDGVYSCDPRIVPKAKKLKVVSYDEMLELAILGAKVLQHRSVELAKTHNNGIITGIAHDFNVAKVVVFGVPDKPGIAARIFGEISKLDINIQMIVQSAQTENMNDIAFTCSIDEAKEAQDALEKVVKEIGARSVVITDNLAKVSIVGAGMMTHTNIASRMFSALAGAGVNIDMISTSEITISVIVESDKCQDAVQALAKEFDLLENK